MKAGQYVRVIATPAAKADLALSLQCTQWPKPLLSDAAELRGEFAEEEVAWVTRKTDSCWLELASSSAQAVRYTLKIWGPHRPSPKDQLRAQAIGSSIRAEIPTKDLTVPELKQRLAQIEEGPELWKRLGDAKRQADASFYLAQVCAKLSMPDCAFENYKRSAELHHGQGDFHWEAAARNNRGNILRIQGLAAEAVAELDKALELYPEIPPELLSDKKIQQARALSNRGNAKIDLFHLGEAIQDLEQARRLFDAAGDKTGLSITLSILGDAYNARNEQGAARQSFEQALALAEETGDEDALASSLHGLGTYHLLAGNWAKSSAYLGRSLKSQREGTTARTYINLGRALFFTGEHERARGAYKKALAILEKLPTRDREAEINAHSNMAFLELEEGVPGKAKEEIRRALTLAGEDETLKVASLEIEGAILRRSGEFSLARDSLKEALSLVEKLGIPGRRGSLLLELAHVELAAGFPAEARNHAKEALENVESTRSQLLGEDQRSAHLASRRNYYDLYIAALLKLGKTEEALAVSERARARSLLETLGSRQFDIREDEADAGKLEQRRKLLGEVQDAGYRVSQLRKRRSSKGEVQRAEIDLNKRLQDLNEVEDDLRETSKRYAALTKPVPLLGQEIRQRVVDGGALLLEFWLGEEQGVVWAVTSERIQTFPILESRKAIEQKARCYYEALRAPGLPPDQHNACSSRRALRESGNWLSEKLLAPVADAGILDRRPLLIVADGALHYIPFAALPDPAAPGRPPLLSRHAVVHLPSASVLAALRDQPKARNSVRSGALLLADPVFRPDDSRIPAPLRSPSSGRLAGTVRDALSPWQRLPDTAQEAEGICRLLRPARCDILSDFEASTAKLQSIDLSAYGVVHFATHGDVNSDMPELSRLVLSLVDDQGRTQKPGFLYLYDVYNLKLDADLVVLSACNTALGKEFRGEGLVGLTRGFLYAGARSVVASLWSVDSAATQHLMTAFYSHLIQKGVSPAEALRAAQREMADSRNWSAPYYWAGFTLQGEWR